MANFKKTNFLDSAVGVATKGQLQQMAADESYNTAPSYSANRERYPNNLIPFVDKHMNYLVSHPSLDPRHYLANLRLMTRLK